MLGAFCCSDGGVDQEFFGPVSELDGEVAGYLHEFELVDGVHGE